MPHLPLGLAIALAAGLGLALIVEEPGQMLPSVMLAAAWGAAMVGLATGRGRVLLAGSIGAVCAAGWLLGAQALDRAVHAPLRRVVEQRLGGLASDQAAAPDAAGPITIEGRLREDATMTGAGATLRIDVERVWLGPCPEAAPGGVFVTVLGAQHAAHVGQWTAGRVVRAPAWLRRPARYLNHGVPDQERALAQREATLVGSVKSASLVEVRARGRWWQEGAAWLRARSRAAIRRHVPAGDGQAAAIGTAILIGDRSTIDVQVERRLQEAGTYHVIAISGGNIAILAGLLIGTLALAGLRGRGAAVAAIAALAAYAVVAAGGPSVARATVMAVLYLAVRLIDQRTAAANAIAFAGAVLLIASPLSIADIGFWLTFGATGAILVGVAHAPRLTGSLRTLALGVLLASACAEVALAPMAARVFQRVTLAGLLLNFVALPAMTAVQLGALAVVLLDTAGLAAAAGWAGQLVAAGSSALTGSARLLDVAPWLTWRVPSPSPAVMAGYYTALGTAMIGSVLRVPGWLRRVSAAATVLLLVWIVAAPHARVRARGDGRLHLSLLDVGQGDAMLVTFPDGRRLVVDTGGAASSAFDIGERVVAPALRARHVLGVDYLAVTHADPDHVGGARALVRDFRPREIWWGIPVAGHAPTDALRHEAARAGSAWRTLQRGDRFEAGGVDVRVLHPPPPDWERQRVRNDDSLVLELRFGRVSVLLTGDISREVEGALLTALDLLPTVVLKVPHHGSATSSGAAFIAAVAPAIALIGVGRGNPYGHPVGRVLERLQAAGADVYRTDQDGQVDVATDGRTVAVSTWTGRRGSR